MPKTNHHFVPQFYLRNFSNNGRSISLVNIAQAKAIESTSIAGQCYRRKFYGETDELEDAFSALEAKAAPIIKAIIQGQPVRRHSSEHAFLLYFVALQAARTRRAIEGYARIASLYMTHILNKSLESEGKNFGGFRVNVSPSIGYSLASASDRAIGSTDLDICVLRIPYSSRFITSDVPVVTYNQWCEGIKNEGVLGIAASGLQTFFPLSPYCQLMFFDESIYSVRKGKNGEITILRPGDVDQLNRLQTVFAQENLYFDQWGNREKVLKYLQDTAEQRCSYSERLEVYGEAEPNPHAEAFTERMHGYVSMPNMNLQLSFCSLQKDVQKVPVAERPYTWRYNDFSLFNNPPPDNMREVTRLRSNGFRKERTESWKGEWKDVIP